MHSTAARVPVSLCLGSETTEESQRFNDPKLQARIDRRSAVPVINAHEAKLLSSENYREIFSHTRIIGCDQMHCRIDVYTYFDLSARLATQKIRKFIGAHIFFTREDIY